MSEATPSPDNRSLSNRFEQLVGAMKSWADALHVAARHSIVHCDIKPENIRIPEQDHAKRYRWMTAEG
jgi:hypothetical protein